jgi:peptidoglycan-associated lipoprotein
MIRNRWTPLVCAAATALVLTACSAKRPKTAAASRASAPTSPATSVAPPGAAQPPSVVADSVLSGDLATLNRKGYLKDAFFNYDKADLRPDARQVLTADAAWLKKYSSTRLLIEGHCDERGTEEYNLALGDRRANAVREYLGSLGVPAARVATVSYG